MLHTAIQIIQSISSNPSLIAFFGLAIILLAFISRGVKYVWRQIFRYPETPFGFRAKLIFADDTQESKKIFRNKRYGVSCRPDFIYKLESGRLCYIEAKSRNRPIKSDIVQLEVGILAIRSELNVTAGAILTGNNQIHWVDSAKCSSSKLYRRNKKLIKRSREIHSGHQPPIKKSNSCKSCPFKSKCFPA